RVWSWTDAGPARRRSDAASSPAGAGRRSATVPGYRGSGSATPLVAPGPGLVVVRSSNSRPAASAHAQDSAGARVRFAGPHQLPVGVDQLRALLLLLRQHDGAAGVLPGGP